MHPVLRFTNPEAIRRDRQVDIDLATGLSQVREVQKCVAGRNVDGFIDPINTFHVDFRGRTKLILGKRSQIRALSEQADVGDDGSDSRHGDFGSARDRDGFLHAAEPNFAQHFPPQILSLQPQHSSQRQGMVLIASRELIRNLQRRPVLDQVGWIGVR